LDLLDLVVATEIWDLLVLPDLLDPLVPLDLPEADSTSSASPSRRRLPIPSVAAADTVPMPPT